MMPVSQETSLSPRPTTASRYRPPPGAVDTHAHVFEAAERFPLAPDAAYVPPVAPVGAYLAALEQIGIARGVLVQGAPYGTDNTVLLQSLSRFPDRLRGVALASDRVEDDTLAAFAAAGVRGLRFSHFPDATGRHVAAIGLPDLQRLAPRMREHGLHAQLWTPCEELVAHAPMLLGLGVPLVIDHLARVRTEDGPAGGAFLSLLAILRAEDVWLKLTPHRASARFPSYPDIRPFHDAALAARPDRLVWGTDWPFVRMGAATPDAGHLLDLFAEWTPDEAVRRAILVDNPERLYGF